MELTSEYKREYFGVLLEKMGQALPTDEETWAKVDKCVSKSELRALAIQCETQMTVTPVTAEQKAQLEQMNRLLTPNIARLEQEIEVLLRDATNYQQESDRKLSIAYDKALAIKEYQATKHDLPGMIGQIVSDGFYRLVEIQPDAVVFQTQPITLEHDDLRVKLGEFKVKFEIKTGIVRVTRVAGYVMGSYPHPHVAGDQVCKGTAAAAIATATAAADIPTIMECYRAILTTYGAESPFRSLEKFAIELHPELFEDETVEFEQSGTRYYLPMYIPENIHRGTVVNTQVGTCPISGEDTTLVAVQTYLKYYPNNGYRSSKLYVKVRGKEKFLPIVHHAESHRREDLAVDTPELLYQGTNRSPQEIQEWLND